MKDVRIDQNGEFRCWNCGGKQFLEKRTGRAHVTGFVTVGIGALATKKKLKCHACGEYNDTGSAKPWNGPANKRLANKYGTGDSSPAMAAPPPPPVAAPPPPPPPVPTPSVPAGWNPDPRGRYELRYWDGQQWTNHVATGGGQTIDPNGV